ncbi:glycosyltransferase family protein [Pseudokordiimonas caeni]|uniref:glycosyltransferase family protein n=1 Tax=Pseudokordiimonas caeni TaxID=2997908 RepID=UPI002811A9A9|nr:glycosyltransferase family protein [Pseudokordiimonas caeni]
MKAVCIVQARRGSSRLPDKILKPIGHTTALESCLKRCLRIPGIDEVICAGVDRDEEQPVFDIATAVGASIFRGDEANVLSRYHSAAEAAGADYVMRITSDCPLVDPDVCGQLLGAVMDGGYAFGGISGFPHGLDCEVFTMAELKRAFRETSSSMEREHVTLGIKNRKENRMLHLVCPQEYRTLQGEIRLVLDYPEDHAFFDTLFNLAGPIIDDMTWLEVKAFILQHHAKLQQNKVVIEDWKQSTAAIMSRARSEGIEVGRGFGEATVEWRFDGQR